MTSSVHLFFSRTLQFNQSNFYKKVIPGSYVLVKLGSYSFFFFLIFVHITLENDTFIYFYRTRIGRVFRLNGFLCELEFEFFLVITIKCKNTNSCNYF